MLCAIKYTSAKRAHISSISLLCQWYQVLGAGIFKLKLLPSLQRREPSTSQFGLISTDDLHPA